MYQFRLLCAVAMLGGAPAWGQILTPEKSDLYSLVIAPIDLTDTSRVMTVYDLDEDGFIDKEEQKRLSWRDEIGDFDLNRDGKLTHLEVTVRHAKMRSDAGVEQQHVNNAKVFMNRHDKNRNGQLDAEEIANGWPSEPEEFDANRDGAITLGEMAMRFAFMAGLRREMGIEQVDQVTSIRTVRKLDRDKDQKLDADEQKGAFLPLPAADFDEDDDDKLSIMEIATMLAKHRRESGMSKSDLMRVRTLFERFDADANGTIDETEYESAAAAFPNATGPHPLAAYDGNGDEVVTQSEVQKAITSQRKSLGFDDGVLAEARKLLTRHDVNRDMYLNENELHESPRRGQLSKSILKLADQDDDKRVSLVELAKHLAKKQAKE